MKHLFVLTILVAAINVLADAHQTAFNLIALNEGFKSKVYPCTAGKPPIGFGFTSERLVSKGTISRKEAEDTLHDYVDCCLKAVDRLPIRVPLTNNQKAVLADMVYHFGSTAILEAGDLLGAINSGNPDRVKTQLSRWVKQKKVKDGKIVRDANGKPIYEVVPGLVTRQERLVRLWTK